MYMYCLFCETVKVRFVAAAVTALYGCRAISPKQVQHTWEKGRMTDRIRDLLPGYLFVYSEEPIEISAAKYLPSVLRVLRTNEQRYELSGSDEAFAGMLLKKEGILGKTPVYEENNRIHLKDGIFAGMDAKILKVDRRAGRMQIEIPFTGRLVKTWIEYEIESNENESNEVTLTQRKRK